MVEIGAEELHDLVFSAVAAERAGQVGWRGHLGASVIADNCERKGYYTFRWYSRDEKDGRTHLLLARGQREEPAVVDSLRSAGFNIEEYENKRRKRQWSFIDPDNPAFAGSCDGICTLPRAMDPEQTPFVLEIKTANQANFRKMRKKGLLISRSKYFGQAQTYMRWCRYKGILVDRTLFVIVNKNDDDRYYEWVKYDPAFARDLALKAHRILSADGPDSLLRLSNKPENYECGFCQHKPVCHEGATPEKNCRTCRHVQHLQYPAAGRSRWRCGGGGEHEGKVLTKSLASLGCDKWEP